MLLYTSTSSCTVTLPLRPTIHRAFETAAASAAAQGLWASALAIKRHATACRSFFLPFFFSFLNYLPFCHFTPRLASFSLLLNARYHIDLNQDLNPLPPEPPPEQTDSASAWGNPAGSTNTTPAILFFFFYLIYVRPGLALIPDWPVRSSTAPWLIFQSSHLHLVPSLSSGRLFA